MGKRAAHAALSIITSDVRPNAGGDSAGNTRTSPTTRNAELDVIAGDPAAPLALDRVIHERMRLAIVSALAAHSSLAFNELKSLLNTTDGNLSVHARKLEGAGYVTCTKRFEGRVPRTDYALTPEGRAALERYLAHMAALIRSVQP
jgi:DNA-binding transcriptional ArsR family regulator